VETELDSGALKLFWLKLSASYANAANCKLASQSNYTESIDLEIVNIGQIF